MAGHARALLGDFDDGIAMLQESLELRERFGDAVGAMFCKLNLADSYDRAGRAKDARRALRRCLRVGRRRRDHGASTRGGAWPRHHRG